MILVTGHEGFIGTYLIGKLADLGIRCAGYDLVNGDDIRDACRLDRVFDTYQPKTVIHLAALAGARRGEAYPQEYFDTNVIGTENVIKMCEKYGVKKLIAFSSSSAKSRNNTYGITKYAMELMLAKSKIPTVHTVRPFNVFAKHGRKDQVFAKWKSRIEAGLPIEYHGDLKRHYTHIDDIVNGVIELLNDNKVGHFVSDFGNPNAVSLSTILGWFKEKYPDMKVIENPVENDVFVSPEGYFKCETELTKEFI